MDELLLASLPQWRGAVAHLRGLMGARWTPELARIIQGEIESDLAEKKCVELLRAELLRRFARNELVPMRGAVACIDTPPQEAARCVKIMLLSSGDLLCELRKICASRR